MCAWATAERTYEGFPLFLRSPTDVDTPDNRRNFPDLVIITHTFAKRYPDARPEPDYNETLRKLDHVIVTAFDFSLSGVPVLVETFGGKRNYYFRVLTRVDVAAIGSAIATSYPNEQISWDVRPKIGWSFLDRYAKDFF